MAETNSGGTGGDTGGGPRLEAWLGAVLLALVAIAVFFLAGRAMSQKLPEVAAEGAGAIKASEVLFYLLAAMAIVSGAGVAFSRNIIYSALALLGALLSAAGLYVYLSADYVAVTQLLIYVGGVLVLILFAVMLTSRIGDVKHSNPSAMVLPGLGLLFALVVLLGYVAMNTPWKVAAAPSAVESTAAGIGDVFLREYLLPFEVASLVLLATLIGAVVVARKEIKE